MDVPLSHILFFAGWAVLAAVVAIPFLRFTIRIAPQLGLVDWPKARGVANEQVPIIGGALVILLLIAIGALVHLKTLSPWILLTALVIAIMGHLDDRKPLSPYDKLFWQILCATTIVVCDPNICVTISERFGSWGMFLSIFFIVGMMNAINFIDGIDGLAATVIIVGAIGVVLFALPQPNYQPQLLLAAVITGIMVPFLYLNVARRKGFLGNTGSYFFAYMLAVLHLSIPLEGVGAISRVSISALCFLVPVADTIMVLGSRSFTLRSPFQADKGHLHHRLIQSAIPLRYVLLNFGMISLSGLVMAHLLILNPNVNQNHLAFFVCLTQILVATALILMVERVSKWRVEGYIRRFDKGEPVRFLTYRLKSKDGQPISLVRLWRLEARLSAELRVTDICFIDRPDHLYVVLKSNKEPVEYIANRFEQHFMGEGLDASQLVESGEFKKKPDSEKEMDAMPRHSGNLRRIG